MFLACLLLVIAIFGGTLLTFLFDRSAPRGARLCMGASIGMALMATVGFLLSLVLGLGPAAIVLTSVILLLPGLLLINPERRAVILSAARSPASAAQKSNAAGIGYLIFYLALALLLAMVFQRAVFERSDGIYTGVMNNLGDLPLHLQIINSFAQGHNLPPEDPTYAGVRFAYPFLVDFLAAMLARAGASLIATMWLQNMVLALALVGAMHYWTLLLTRNRTAGIIAPLLVLFSGGLGWWLLFSDATSSNGLFSLLANLPHDYTILPDSILRWGNSLTTLFVPQRSILFGMPLAITIFCQWWLAISQQENAPSDADPTATSALEQKTTINAKPSKSRRKASRKGAAHPQPEPANFYLRRMM